MDEIRIGLVGLGSRAVHIGLDGRAIDAGWLPQMLRMPGFRIAAVCDWIEPLHQRAIGAIPYGKDVRTFREYEDLLAWDGIDAVALCVRRLDQGAMAAQALEAGKHVNSECPGAHTIEDCWRIVLAAERSGKLYHLAEQVRYAGFVEAWKQVVAAGRLGRIVYVEGQYISYMVGQFFRDFTTGQSVHPASLDKYPNARPTTLHAMPPIHYLSHELCPMLKVIDDRVVQVVGMSTGSPSYHHPEIRQPDFQVALMKTEKDAILRMACGFTCAVPRSAIPHHWYHVHGTRGRLESNRSANEKMKMWSADEQMEHPACVDWTWRRHDAPAEAKGSPPGMELDYFAQASFRDALLSGKAPESDVYGAMDTAAPAILASDSIDQGSVPIAVPDFRPGPHRKVGEAPKNVGVMDHRAALSDYTVER